MQLPTLILLATLAGALTASAQITPVAPPASDDVTRLERYIVTGLPLELSVNPLARETSAIMGDSRGPLDTPRAASTITAALVDERGIHGLREILEDRRASCRERV